MKIQLLNCHVSLSRQDGLFVRFGHFLFLCFESEVVNHEAQSFSETKSLVIIWVPAKQRF